MSVVGFSTGALAYGDFERALTLLEPTRATAVELSALRSAELPELLNALPRCLKHLNERYGYISVHAPTDFKDERSLIRQLVYVADLGLNVIVHPDTIRDILPWRELGSRLCLENMDSRKTTGRSVEELRPFFADLPQARLCFDIAHARQVDGTMSEARGILSVFGNRLEQVHLSEINSKGTHIAMSFAAKRDYESFAGALSRVPIILESIVNENAIVTEIDEAEKLLLYPRLYDPATSQTTLTARGHHPRRMT